MHRAPKVTAARRCQNLYQFIRHRLDPDVSDREIARRWAMSWRSFVNLKEGARRVPRVEELEALGELLGVDPMVVFLVARGEPATVVNRWLLGGEEVVRAELFARVRATSAKSKEASLHSSLERIPGAVFTIDMKGRIEDLDARLLTLLGADLRTIARSQLLEFISAGSAAKWLELQVISLNCGEAGPAKLLLENGTPISMRVVRIDKPANFAAGFQCLALPTGPA